MENPAASSQSRAGGVTETIRPAVPDDVPSVISLDQRITGLAKPEYWNDTFDRYGRRSDRFFLVSDNDQGITGFIIGEVRAWEFGSPPCGWIFALGVDPGTRLGGTGSRLLAEICRKFKKIKVDKVRTMLGADDHLNMSFFRSQGMKGGPFIQLEKYLVDD